MTHGGKLPEIAKMLSGWTGRAFEHQDVYNVVRKLQKRFLVTDTETEEEKVEFWGMQVPAQELPSHKFGYGRQWRRGGLES